MSSNIRIDKRDSNRINISLNAYIYISSYPVSISAKVLNISEAGICFLLSDRYEHILAPKQRLSFQVIDSEISMPPTVVEATIQYILTMQDTIQIGCLTHDSSFYNYYCLRLAYNFTHRGDS